MFRKYDKVHRLGKDEVEGILEGTVAVQEKIDGANTSIWLEDNIVHYGSRNQEIINKEFNGFIPYMEKTGVAELLKRHPTFVLYGEWLVKHTVSYNEKAYREWYLFDIYTRDITRYLPANQVEEIAYQYMFNFPTKFGFFINPTKEQLQEYVGKSSLGPKGEGIVIKNDAFINRWGDHCHAKLVHQEFLEDNALVFNSNNKASESYTEQYIVNKWLNNIRVKKVIDKLQPEINEKLDLKHIPRITNSVYYDLISEEGWEIAKLNKEINYKTLKNLALRKAKLLYMELLENVSSMS